MRLRAVPICVAIACLASGRSSARDASVAVQLDRYLRGEHDAVVAELAALTDFDPILEQLKRDGPSWIDAGGADERARRELTAATYALEAARAGAWLDWKLVQEIRVDMGGLTAPDVIIWKAPPQLIEWGCALLRRDETPRPAERVWQLAAVAVAQRAEDYEFLIGSPWDGRGNAQDEIEHLNHALKRFPKEARFVLAQAIAVEWRTWRTSRRPLPRRSSSRQLPEAMKFFQNLAGDEAVGGEALVRLGALRHRAKNFEGALEMFARAERSTRDRYLIYLARYFKGQALESMTRSADAERAYRGALATIPHTSSATMALAAVLMRSDRRAEASAIVEASLSARPPPADPWREYAHADDRFWPELVGRLRAEIRK